MNPLEGLDKWYAEKWVDLGRSIDSKGHIKVWVQCGRPSAKKGKYPKCVPLAKAKAMTPAQRLSAVRRKRSAEASAPSGKGRRPLMVKTLQKNPRPFLEREHDWKEVLIQKGRKKITRKQICDYYQKNRKKIWPYLKDQMVMVMLAPSKNKFVRRRKTGSPEKYIHLTKLDGIEDPHSFEYWINRRTIEFHPVISGAMTDQLWVDLDMHKTKSKTKRAELLRKMKKAAPKIKKVMRKMGVARPVVYDDGAGGIHIQGKLATKKNVNKLRRDFRAALSTAFEDDPVFTTGLAKTGQIRLDTTTLHKLGSLRAPYSFSVEGKNKAPI